MNPPDTDDWVALSGDPLPVGAAADWVVVPRCGAVALFVGTARDHAGDRVGVERLTYEAYEEQAVPKLAAVAAEVRTRWPEVGRVALLHRTGELAIGDAAVVVAVSTPHRGAAFDAARFAIDAVKATVPIWKKEAWGDGESWGLEAQHLVEAADVESEASRMRSTVAVARHEQATRAEAARRSDLGMAPQRARTS